VLSGVGELQGNDSGSRLFHRLEAAEVQYTQNPLGTGTDVVGSPGDFRYLPPTSIQESYTRVPERFVRGRESVSVLNNVTVRETKRPQARVSDVDYKRRFSSSPSALRAGIDLHQQHQQGSSSGHQSPQFRGTTGGRGDVSPLRHSPIGTPALPGLPDPGGSGSNRRDFPSRNGSTIYSDDGDYLIYLSFDGRRVEHRVTPHMMVAELAQNAADVFGLDSHGLVLVLFGMQPHTLHYQRRLQDPPPLMLGGMLVIRESNQQYATLLPKEISHLISLARNSWQILSCPNSMDFLAIGKLGTNLSSAFFQFINWMM
jgi:hypothetical protein